MPRLRTATLLAATLLANPALAADDAKPPGVNWSFTGLFGSFDRAAAQRGWQVYSTACANCHSLTPAYYRNLAGIGMAAQQVKATAAGHMVPTRKEGGGMTERPALPSDHFRAPYPDEETARAANNGNLPPDLSVITKARDGGPDYVYAILTGYDEPPASVRMMPGMAYNRAFPGHQIAMFPPLNDDDIEYADGTKATLDQEARDVVTFLAFIASPELDARKRLGLGAVLFFLLLTGLTYAVKRRVWRGVH
jgi:ubiquinol-cytochrome c reductase cytochrome c1 subunit